MPLSGHWKTMIRLADGRSLGAIPIYLPADAVLHQPEISATPRFDRPVQRESTILQRERKTGVPGWLWAVASMVVLGCSLTLLLALGWGVGRVSRSAPADDRVYPSGRGSTAARADQRSSRLRAASPLPVSGASG